MYAKGNKRGIEYSTFHYGSIKIIKMKDYLVLSYDSTFHYGSIKINEMNDIKDLFIILYIPLWFY